MKHFFKIFIFAAVLFLPSQAHAIVRALQVVSFGTDTNSACKTGVEQRWCYLNRGAKASDKWFLMTVCASKADIAKASNALDFIKNTIGSATVQTVAMTYDQYYEGFATKGNNYFASFTFDTTGGASSSCLSGTFLTDDACKGKLGGEIVSDVKSCGESDVCLAFPDGKTWCKQANPYGSTSTSGTGKTSGGKSGGSSGGGASSGGGGGGSAGSSSSDSGDGGDSSGGDSEYASPSTSAGSINLINPLAKTVSSKQPIQSLAARLINVMFGISGSVALFMFVLGGFLWLASAGNETMVHRGRDIFQWSSLGLVVMFSSYVIVQYLFGTLLGEQGADGGDATGDNPALVAEAGGGGGSSGSGGGAPVKYACCINTKTETVGSKKLGAGATLESVCSSDDGYAEEGACSEFELCATDGCLLSKKGVCAKDAVFSTSKYKDCVKAFTGETEGAATSGGGSGGSTKPTKGSGGGPPKSATLKVFKGTKTMQWVTFGTKSETDHSCKTGFDKRWCYANRGAKAQSNWYLMTVCLNSSDIGKTGLSTKALDYFKNNISKKIAEYPNSLLFFDFNEGIATAGSSYESMSVFDSSKAEFTSCSQGDFLDKTVCVDSFKGVLVGQETDCTNDDVCLKFPSGKFCKQAGVAKGFGG